MFKYARFQMGRGFSTWKTSLKLVSTMLIALMTVHTRKPKPIQPNVHTSNCAIRSKSAFEIERACAANSSAAMRLRSRSSSLMGATLARSSSCARSTFVIIASICWLIFSRAKSSAPQIFATERSTQRSGTSESIAKYVSPAACIAQWLVLKSLIMVLNHLTIFFFISDAP